jgi:predicted ester cyclase
MDRLENVGWAILLALIIFVLLWAVRRRRAYRAAERRRVTAEENRRKARRLYEAAFGAGDLTVVDEVVGEGFFHPDRRRGPEGLKRAVASLRRAFPDLRVSVEEQGAEGDTVTTRCTLRGTDLGGVLWYPPTGKRAAFEATYTDRFSGGVLVEHRGGADTGSLLEQLGLPPSGD